MTVPVARDRCGGVTLLLRQPRPAPVARPRQRRRQFLFDHLLDKAAHFRAKARFDRIEPIVEKLFFCRISRRLRAIFPHDVISIGVGTPSRFE
jgi:hypothetical protein